MDDVSKSSNKISLLKQIPIFSKLNWFDLRTVSNKCTLVEHKKGDIVCRQGNPPDGFYCLISGRLLAYITKDGLKTQVEFIHRGVYFGIISLLTGENHSLTFEAINDSLLFKIEKDDFLSILKQIPSLGVEFSRSLSRRLKRKELNVKSVFESTVISIYSPVAGVGSSTYALNLALSLRKETGKKVVYVSIDTKSQDQGKQTGFSTVPAWRKNPIAFENIIGDDRKILQSVLISDSFPDSLNIIFDPQNFSIINRIGYFVSILANDYHFVVVDLPNQMDEIVLKTLIQSDVVQIVTNDDVKSLMPVTPVLEKIKAGLKEGFSPERVQVVLNCLSRECRINGKAVSKTINYPVSLILPFFDLNDQSIPIENQNLMVHTPSLDSPYNLAVKSIARKIGGVMVGLVLGGGAALGLAHIGVIKVLEKEKIPIDIVIGSSMGALIASLWATGKDSQALANIAIEFKERSAIFRLLDPIFPKAGIIGGYAIIRWLKKHLGNKTFQDVERTIKVVAYDLAQREELIIEEGPIIEAVRKSIAIPGVMEPIVAGERLIIDGGILNPLPTNVLTPAGVNKVIAVNVLPSPEDVLRGLEISRKKYQEKLAIKFTTSPLKFLRSRFSIFLEKLFYPNISDIIVRSLQATGYIIAEQSATHADVTIHPDLAGIDWFELYRGEELIKKGEEAALGQLPAIKKLVTEFA